MTTLWHLSETTSSSVSHLEVIFSLEILLLATMHKRPFCRSSGEAALPLCLCRLWQHWSVNGLSRTSHGRVVRRPQPMLLHSRYQDWLTMPPLRRCFKNTDDALGGPKFAFHNSHMLPHVPQGEHGRSRWCQWRVFPASEDKGDQGITNARNTPLFHS